MRDFLLDTQTIRYWHDTGCVQHETVVRNIARLRQAAVGSKIQSKLLVSVVTLGEIEFGHRVAFAPDSQAQATYLAFVRQELPDTFELSRDAAEAYGELRARLFQKFAPGIRRKPKMRPEQLVDPAAARELGIQENDLWLCSQAIAHGMVLVTNDGMARLREVAQDISGMLILQNWTVENAARVPE